MRLERDALLNFLSIFMGIAIASYLLIEFYNFGFHAGYSRFNHEKLVKEGNILHYKFPVKDPPASKTDGDD